MKQPQGYAQTGKEHLVCKLNKFLYGLGQSSQMWHKRIDAYLRSLEMTRSKSDHNLYYT